MIKPRIEFNFEISPGTMRLRFRTIKQVTDALALDPEAARVTLVVVGYISYLTRSSFYPFLRTVPG